jgi:hypothetical protein
MNKLIISSIADECLKDIKYDEDEDFVLSTDGLKDKDLEGYGLLDWFQKLKDWTMAR